MHATTSATVLDLVRAELLTLGEGCQIHPSTSVEPTDMRARP
jgi:hypothetical protein